MGQLMEISKGKTALMLILMLIFSTSGCINSASSNEDIQENLTEDQEFDRPNKNLDAKIVKIEFDRDDYIAGEKVTAELLIANIGDETIIDEKIELEAKVVTLNDFMANMYLKTMTDEGKTRDFTIEFDKKIEPESVKSIKAIFSTQKEMQGRSLAGNYEITINLFINDQWADSEVLPIKLKGGTPREFSPEPDPTSTPEPTSTSTPTSTPTPTPSPTPTPTLTPTPTPTPEPIVVDEPTGNITYARVKAWRFANTDLVIDAGDEVLWDNHDDTAFTIVEMNGKLENLTLGSEKKLKYLFNTTGYYRFELYYSSLNRDPSTQNITVRLNASQ